MPDTSTTAQDKQNPRLVGPTKKLGGSTRKATPKTARRKATVRKPAKKRK